MVAAEPKPRQSLPAGIRSSIRSKSSGAPCRSSAGGAGWGRAGGAPPVELGRVAGIGVPAIVREAAPPSRVMARSRSTLAMIEAAAIDSDRPSPPITHWTVQASGGGWLPSTSARSGGVGRRETARRIASRAACRMLSRLISDTEAAPTPISARPEARRARRRSASARRTVSSNRRAVRPAGAGRRMGTPPRRRRTGPASGPRPTSSTPATRPPARFSRAKFGTPDG